MADTLLWVLAATATAAQLIGLMSVALFPANADIVRARVETLAVEIHEKTMSLLVDTLLWPKGAH